MKPAIPVVPVKPGPPRKPSNGQPFDKASQLARAEALRKAKMPTMPDGGGNAA